MPLVPGTMGTAGLVFIPSGHMLLSGDRIRIPLNYRLNCSQSTLNALHTWTSREEEESIDWVIGADQQEGCFYMMGAGGLLVEPR